MAQLLRFALIALLFCFTLVSEIQTHSGMKYPPPRPSAPGSKSNADENPINDEGGVLGVLENGKILNRYFPCGSNITSPTITKMSPGETINVVLTSSNNHGGGDCQFGLAFKNDSAYVIIHTIFDTCLKDVGKEVTYPVKLPDKIPGGPAIFCWGWITVKEFQYYQACSDVVFPGERNGTVTGKAMVVVDVDKGLRGKSRGENGDLVHNAPEVTVTVSGDNVTVVPSEFSPTRPLKVNDPLLKFFKNGGKTVGAKDARSPADPAGGSAAPSPAVGTSPSSNASSNASSSGNAYGNTNASRETPDPPTGAPGTTRSSPAPNGNVPAPPSNAGSSSGSAPSGFTPRTPQSPSPAPGGHRFSSPISGPSSQGGSSPAEGGSSSAPSSPVGKSTFEAPLSSSSSSNPYAGAHQGSSSSWS